LPAIYSAHFPSLHDQFKKFWIQEKAERWDDLEILRRNKASIAVFLNDTGKAGGRGLSKLLDIWSSKRTTYEYKLEHSSLVHDAIPILEACLENISTRLVSHRSKLRSLMNPDIPTQLLKPRMKEISTYLTPMVNTYLQIQTEWNQLQRTLHEFRDHLDSLDFGSAEQDRFALSQALKKKTESRQRRATSKPEKSRAGSGCR